MARPRRTKSETAALTPEAFLADYPPDIQALAHQLRRLVKQSVPNVSEQVSAGWKLIGYRVLDGRRNRYFCFIAPQADAVRLGFEYGVLMVEQEHLEGDGSQVRYVTVRNVADLNSEQLGPLIADAAIAALA